MINNMDFNKIFGRNLRRIMAEREITQAQMSRDLDIPKTTISGWMNGKRAPKMSMFDKICNYLSCKRSDLMEPHTGKSHYYTNPETEQIAQYIYENSDMRLLFDAARGSNSDNLKLAAEMLKRMKQTNNDG